MSPVKNVMISSGSVTFHGEGEAALLGLRPAPAFFEVSFMLDVESEADGLPVRNIFHLSTRVGGLPEDTPWAEVEALAFVQLAPLLEGIAGQLDGVRP
ncbi:hypothetical protein [Brevundimonas sp.]|jgi:hypothetical protein|uniref:hypothetical protein n=1 Tax=Brevundimonas sp. TaxID=1871086 RepID=UPI002EDA5258